MRKKHQEASATVLLSGGQDSATCLAWALETFSAVRTLGFDYGQRHRIECESAKRLAKRAKVDYHCLKLDFIPQLGKNALTDPNCHITQKENELPSTFVPGRNVFFLSIAATWAYQQGDAHVVTGVCQSDYSGYPDCRQNFVTALQQTLSLALDTPMTLHTPLMQLSKAQSIRLMQDLGKLDWYADTHTCYEGKRPPCQNCPACKLRKKGFDHCGLVDPLDAAPQA
ncbi:MAG: 7-cyano-7-deazaguanine synthase QueC [bacterium]